MHAVVMHGALGAAPPFSAHVERVTSADLRWSWRPGCPVPPAELRRLRLSYWGFDGRRHLGELVVRDRVTPDVVRVFRVLYREHFPIRRLESVDRYRADDHASMAADNTSAFNCRAAAVPGPKHWSMHAYGEAIDVNPLENPYVLGDTVSPPAGRRFLDRSGYRTGMAVAGSALVRAFDGIGWGWGGHWAGSKDYQHFSRNGR